MHTSNIVVFNKPFKVLSQFKDDDGRATMAEYIDAPGFYAAGRLDYDSEGLMILTNDGQLQQKISNPKHKLEKTYWVQIEGRADEAQLKQLRTGPVLKDGPTRPAKVRPLGSEVNKLWPREPPIRKRVDKPTQWLEIRISEGRNRQVRRMTAAVGLPTLRLVRVAVGPWRLKGLAVGLWRYDKA
ncbi:MAG: pseudouridine synthase [Oceanospirillaceae bacterium]|jgi:23S rRNA pseudouridine2457 synthase|nr:pseudouridine synthase [Oceanospirillaceae bacterium]MBT4442354.1 pseudouridine synthase [Oceanospirillaceae bacterium]MBT6076407.1 pseudouridine synthase [Oceanospirillaceae bacterium]